MPRLLHRKTKKNVQNLFKNQADLLCYQSEKQIKDSTPNWSTQKKAIEALIQELRTAIQEDKFDLIKRKTADLEKMIMEVGQTIYQGQQSPADIPRWFIQWKW